MRGVTEEILWSTFEAGERRPELGVLFLTRQGKSRKAWGHRHKMTKNALLGRDGWEQKTPREAS